MAGYTPGFQPKSADVVKLNTNENPYPPSPAVADYLKTVDAEDLRRYPDPLFSLFAGGLLIGAIYMATDPVTSPLTPPAGCRTGRCGCRSGRSRGTGSHPSRRRCRQR